MSVSFAKDGNLEADLPRLMSQMHIETLASGSDSRAVSLERSIEQDVGMGEENGSARNEGHSKKDAEGSTQTKKGKKRKQRRSKTAEDLDVETPLEVKTLSLESAIETDDDINGVQNSFEDDPKLNLSISIPLEEQEQTNEEESKIIEESIMESGADGIAAYESANETTQSSSASSLQYASPAKPRTSNQSERLKSFVQQSMQDRYAALNAATNQRKSVAIEKTAEGKDFSRLFLRSPSVNPSDSSRLAFRDFRSQSRISRLPTFSSLSLVDPNGMTQSKALPSYDDLLVSSASSMTVEILKKKIKHIQAESSADETRSKSIAVEEVSSKLLAGSTQSHISLLPKSEQSIRSWATDKIVSEVESQPRNAVETLNLDQAIGRIVDDDEYDLTVTYKLPKSAPFDPEDKLKDVRIKCIENWMRDRGNALYESIFEDELKTKAEREFIEELVDKLVVLMRKIKKCDACQKRPSISVHSVVASSHSTFSLVESPSAGKLEDEEMAEISPPARPEETDDIRRVQMYLLGLTNSWLSQDLTEGVHDGVCIYDNTKTFKSDHVHRLQVGGPLHPIMDVVHSKNYHFASIVATIRHRNYRRVRICSNYVRCFHGSTTNRASSTEEIRNLRTMSSQKPKGGIARGGSVPIHLPCIASSNIQRLHKSRPFSGGPQKTVKPILPRDSEDVSSTFLRVWQQSPLQSLLQLCTKVSLNKREKRMKIPEIRKLSRGVRIAATCGVVEKLCEFVCASGRRRMRVINNIDCMEDNQYVQGPKEELKINNFTGLPNSRKPVVPPDSRWKTQSSDTNNSFLAKIELIIVACRMTIWIRTIYLTQALAQLAIRICSMVPVTRVQPYIMSIIVYTMYFNLAVPSLSFFVEETTDNTGKTDRQAKLKPEDSTQYAHISI
ncbi:unnamed protein product, partial [Nesidiocoris tenuis]